MKPLLAFLYRPQSACPAAVCPLQIMAISLTLKIALPLAYTRKILAKLKRNAHPDRRSSPLKSAPVYPVFPSVFLSELACGRSDGNDNWFPGLEQEMVPDSLPEG
jgi:hypothetical protein